MAVKYLTIDSEHLAWLAGWLEGEGFFYSVTTKGGSCSTCVSGGAAR